MAWRGTDLAFNKGCKIANRRQLSPNIAVVKLVSKVGGVASEFMGDAPALTNKVVPLNYDKWATGYKINHTNSSTNQYTGIQT